MLQTLHPLVSNSDIADFDILGPTLSTFGSGCLHASVQPAATHLLVPCATITCSSYCGKIGSLKSPASASTIPFCFRFANHSSYYFFISLSGQLYILTHQCTVPSISLFQSASHVSSILIPNFHKQGLARLAHTLMDTPFHPATGRLQTRLY